MDREFTLALRMTSDGRSVRAEVVGVADGLDRVKNSAKAAGVDIGATNGALAAMSATAQTTGRTLSQALGMSGVRNLAQEAAQARTQVEATTVSLRFLETTVGKVAVAAGGLAVIRKALDFGGELVNTAAGFDRVDKTLLNITGNAQTAAKEFGFVARQSSYLGTEILNTAGAYAKLEGASQGTALEGQKARDIFAAEAKAASALSLSADDLNSILFATGQMISKNTVYSEELKGQLGERLPGAFNVAARAMGVSTTELNKMLEQGKVVAEDFLPKFAAELDKTYANARFDGIQNNINRITNAWEEYKRSVADQAKIGAIVETTAQSLSGAAKLQQAAPFLADVRSGNLGGYTLQQLQEGRRLLLDMGLLMEANDQALQKLIIKLDQRANARLGSAANIAPVAGGAITEAGSRGKPYDLAKQLEADKKAAEALDKQQRQQLAMLQEQAALVGAKTQLERTEYAIQKQGLDEVNPRLAEEMRNYAKQVDGKNAAMEAEKEASKIVRAEIQARHEAQKQFFDSAEQRFKDYYANEKQAAEGNADELLKLKKSEYADLAAVDQGRLADLREQYKEELALATDRSEQIKLSGQIANLERQIADSRDHVKEVTAQVSTEERQLWDERAKSLDSLAQGADNAERIYAAALAASSQGPKAAKAAADALREQLDLEEKIAKARNQFPDQASQDAAEQYIRNQANAQKKLTEITKESANQQTSYWVGVWEQAGRIVHDTLTDLFTSLLSGQRRSFDEFIGGVQQSVARLSANSASQAFENITSQVGKNIAARRTDPSTPLTDGITEQDAWRAGVGAAEVVLSMVVNPYKDYASSQWTQNKLGFQLQQAVGTIADLVGEIGGKVVPFLYVLKLFKYDLALQNKLGSSLYPDRRPDLIASIFTGPLGGFIFGDVVKSGAGFQWSDTAGLKNSGSYAKNGAPVGALLAGGEALSQSLLKATDIIGVGLGQFTVEMRNRGGRFWLRGYDQNGDVFSDIGGKKGIRITDVNMAGQLGLLETAILKRQEVLKQFDDYMIRAAIKAGENLSEISSNLTKVQRLREFEGEATALGPQLTKDRAQYGARTRLIKDYLGGQREADELTKLDAAYQKTFSGYATGINASLRQLAGGVDQTAAEIIQGIDNQIQQIRAQNKELQDAANKSGGKLQYNALKDYEIQAARDKAVANLQKDFLAGLDNLSGKAQTAAEAVAAVNAQFDQMRRDAPALGVEIERVNAAQVQYAESIRNTIADTVRQITGQSGIADQLGSINDTFAQLAEQFAASTGDVGVNAWTGSALMDGRFGNYQDSLALARAQIINPALQSLYGLFSDSAALNVRLGQDQAAYARLSMPSGLDAGNFLQNFENALPTLSDADLQKWIQAGQLLADMAAITEQLVTGPPPDTASYDAAIQAATTGLDALATSLGGIAADTQAAIDQIMGNGYALSRIETALSAAYAGLGVDGADAAISQISEIVGLIQDRYTLEKTNILSLMQADQQAQQQAVANYQAQVAAINSAKESVRSYLDSFKLSDLSPLTPGQRLAEAQGQYGRMLLQAQAGDDAALQALSGSAQSYLDEARKFYASSPQYTAIFEGVQTSLEQALANVVMPAAPSDADYQAKLLDYQSRLSKLQADTVGELKSVKDVLGRILATLQDSGSLTDEGLAEIVDVLKKPVVISAAVAK